MTKSEQLYEKATHVIPGGVNSPVRAYRNVGMTPKFIERAKGVHIYDVDGNEYLDLVNSWGPIILGHSNEIIIDEVKKACDNGLTFGATTESELVMADLICDIMPSIDMVRMVNSGTEAVMSALRLARGYTGKNKIIKFAGCYHGHVDSMLVTAGSGVMSGAVANSLGVPEEWIKDTVLAEYNNLSSVEKAFKENNGEIAAVIIEPIAANMGVVVPKKEFLEGVQRICKANNALLIFDEVITGFRVSLRGAQGFYGIQPDLTIFGKIIGGGMPVGAFGGRKEIMSLLAPLGNVYQAGTLSGNPIAMTAGVAQIRYLKNHEEKYQELNCACDQFFDEVSSMIKRYDIPCQVNHAASLGCIFFSKDEVKDYETAGQSNVNQYSRFFKYMLEHGVFMAPSQFEAMFFSMAYTKQEYDQILSVMEQYFSNEFR